jgi:hypothetical protein
MSIKERCVVCRVSFRPQRAKQRLCGNPACRRTHRNRSARRRRRRDLEQARAAERERQARRRARVSETATATETAPMSRARSDLEAMEMVQEIQKKLAGLERCVARLSRARSTAQRSDPAAESSGIRG